MNRYDFYRAFWANYADLYPHSPKASQFRAGYGSATPVYRVENTRFGIRQRLGTYVLYTHVIGCNIENHIVPHLRKLGEEFQDMDEFSESMWCKSEYYEHGDSYDINNWREMSEWLEERRQGYEKILRS